MDFRWFPLVVQENPGFTMLENKQRPNRNTKHPVDGQAILIHPAPVGNYR